MPAPAQLEERPELARQLAVAIAVPVALLLMLGLILGRQVLRMAEDATWVDHSDSVIGAADDTLRQIIDQETGLRGYLVARDRVFLEPYERARPLDGFARLHALVADNPPQQVRFGEAQQRYQYWLDFVLPAAQGRDLAAASGIDAMLEHKRRMDLVRAAMSDAVKVEQDLRVARIATATSSTDLTKVLFIALLAASAGVLALLSRRQLASIAETFGAALRAESVARAATEDEAWMRAGQGTLVAALQGEQTIPELGSACLAVLANYVQADVGAFFVKEGGAWHRRAGYALDSRAAGPETFAHGEGLVGRAAEESKPLRVRNLPSHHLKVRSGAGESSPTELVLVASRVDETVNAVIELGFLKAPKRRALELLGRVGESVATSVRSSEYKHRLRGLLEEAQQYTEELQTQQEELRVANEELEVQANALKHSQEQLETQRAELEQTNDQLVQQTHLLDRQNKQLSDKQIEISSKAKEVERASAFKSEFLSNMSHELRTPLNSSLILAKLLADNRDGNLTPEQIKSAETIYAAGNDLLALINDILDLSKIEAGRMDVESTTLPVERVRGMLMRTFEPVARDKGIRFAVDVAASAPASIETDVQRLDQILKNLVSNALKFTDKGEVVVEVSRQGERVAFAVRDTGIGIAPGQQGLIFEAFRQADGTTNRKYGGTGLGLSISRELARLLGGDIAVSSQVGTGSTFTLSLPLSSPQKLATPAVAAAANVSPPAVSTPHVELAEAEEVIEPGRRLVLVVEDDDPFAKILADASREAGFQCLIATTAARGLRLAKKYTPMGVILDINLPDHTGLSVLDQLKHDPSTRHIPVHVISAGDYVETALAMGAAAYTMKPVRREQLLDALRALEARSNARLRRVLVVEDDATLRESLAGLLGRDDVEIRTAGSVAEALKQLSELTFDCVVTDLSLPDQSGFELLETMATEEPFSVPPVIVYTGRSLTPGEEQRLRKYSRSIIVKGARSPERLLDEVTLFLHQVESELPPNQQRVLQQTRHREAVFEGRTILVVEDDVRNLFALTSVLEPKGARVAIARNGREALAALEKTPVDLVLMDVMMPEMDGLEATREIRKNPAWAKLPILALTAKAMRDDQQRCLAAGANDYLAKPLDVEMLLSLLRVWMPKV